MVREWKLVVLGAVVTTFASCVPVARPCDATTCATGCCDTEGRCQPGDAQSACGKGAQACASCATGCSSLRSCVGEATDAGMDAGLPEEVVDAGRTGGRTVTIIATNTRVTDGAPSLDDTLNRLTSLSVVTRSQDQLSSYAGVRTPTSYVVNHVPAGEFLVADGFRWLYATADQVDLGSVLGGRADTKVVTPATTSLTLTVSGLPSWNASDDIVLLSHGADYSGVLSQAPSIAGLAAGSAPTEVRFDYGAVGARSGAGAIESSKGDRLTAVFRRAQLVDAGLEDGGTLPCMASELAAFGTLDVLPGPNAGVLDFDGGSPLVASYEFRTTEFRAAVAQAHPMASATFEVFRDSRVPQVGAMAADLVSCFRRSANSLGDATFSLALVDPFPSWQREVHAQVLFEVSAGMNGLRPSGAVTAVRRPSSSGALQVGPTVLPVVDLTLDGVGAAVLTSVRVRAPLKLTWAANPAGAAPAAYFVGVTCADSDRRTGALFQGFTATPALQLPSGTLRRGLACYVSVDAYESSELASKPYKTLIQATGSATAVTSVFAIE